MLDEPSSAPIVTVNRRSVSSVATIDDAQISLAWDTRDRYEADGIGDKMLALAHSCWRTRGLGDFWQHMLVAEGAVDISVAIVTPEDSPLALFGRAAGFLVGRAPSGDERELIYGAGLALGGPSPGGPDDRAS